MTYHFYRISDVIRKRGGHWALEWPSKCEYWDSPLVLDFLRGEKVPIFEATAVGCAFNLRAIAGRDRGLPMSKAWHVKSTLPTVAHYLDRCCTCPPKTVHATAEGENAAHTGRYTLEFVSSVHRMFARSDAKDSN